jgi:transposase
MRKTPREARDAVAALIDQGLSVREIVRKTGVSKSVVGRVRKSVSPTKLPSNGGRPACLSPADKRFCVRQVCKNKNANATTVRKALAQAFDKHVCVETVRRALRDQGLGSVEKQAKPILTRQQIKNRLKFAKAHKDWTVHDWRRVVFSDESKINRFNSDGRVWAWIRCSDNIQERQVKGTVKHGGGNIMIWSCITAKGPGYLCKIEETMDQVVYKEILQTHLLNTLNFYKMNSSRFIFQHDNDPKHTAKSITAWLEDRGIQTMIWPSQSPDMNPIEHVWALLKSRLNEYESAPAGLLDLWDRVQAEWDKLTEKECLKYIDSMPDRIAAVIKAKGRWTTY